MRMHMCFASNNQIHNHIFGTYQIHKDLQMNTTKLNGFIGMYVWCLDGKKGHFKMQTLINYFWSVQHSLSCKHKINIVYLCDSQLLD